MATTAPERIDRQASTPFYQQLFDVLEARIRRGQIEQGDTFVRSDVVPLEVNVNTTGS